MRTRILLKARLRADTQLFSPLATRSASSSQLMLQNPAMIQPLIQQITANNPQLAQLINQNPEAFYQLLAGDDEEGDFEEGDFGQGGAAGQTVIQLTEQEAEAVRRVSPERGP